MNTNAEVGMDQYNSGFESGGESPAAVYARVKVMGSALLMLLESPYDVEQRTGVIGYDLFGAVSINRHDEQKPYEEFFVFHKAFPWTIALEHACANSPGNYLGYTMQYHPDRAIIVVPSDDVFDLVKMNRAVLDRSYMERAARQQWEERLALRQEVLKAGDVLPLGREQRAFRELLQNPHISGLHCTLEVDALGRVRVVDHSKNGTFIRRLVPSTA